MARYTLGCSWTFAIGATAPVLDESVAAAKTVCGVQRTLNTRAPAPSRPFKNSRRPGATIFTELFRDSTLFTDAWSRSILGVSRFLTTSGLLFLGYIVLPFGILASADTLL